MPCRGARGTCSGDLATGVHQAAVPDWCEHERKRKVKAQNAGAQAALGKGDCVARPEGDVVEYSAILPQRDFAFGASVKIIEDWLRKSFTRDRTEVFNANHPGRGNGPCGACHSGKTNLFGILSSPLWYHRVMA